MAAVAPDDQTHLLTEAPLDRILFLALLPQPEAAAVAEMLQPVLAEVAALVAAVVLQPFKSPVDQAIPQAPLLHRATMAALAFPRRTTAQVEMAVAAVPLR